jgi:hypothetical protein
LQQIQPVKLCAFTRCGPCVIQHRAIPLAHFFPLLVLPVSVAVTRNTAAGASRLSVRQENHEHAVSLHFMHYNFCRIHQSLRVTPAMAAGVTDHVWELEEIIALIA